MPHLTQADRSPCAAAPKDQWTTGSVRNTQRTAIPDRGGTKTLMPSPQRAIRNAVPQFVAPNVIDS